MLKNLVYYLQTLVIRCVLLVVRLFPLGWRTRIVGVLTSWVVRLLPSLSRRAHKNLSMVFPDMPEAARGKILAQVGRNTGRTLTEIMFNQEYAAKAADFSVEGPGLQALRDAQDSGKGAILVSGHFGQWEAIRHALKAKGIEVGAVYRPNNNPYYEPLFLAGIEAGGRPIIPKGTAGNRTLLKHVRDGGVLALLMDQYVQDGAVLTFMGHPACTSLSAAELAMRYDLPLIPVFGTRNSGLVDVELETPIAHSTAERMMQGFNDRLGRRVAAHPGQWHWLHQRWRPGMSDVIWPPEGWTPPRGEA